jgi:hypothetical protein
VKLKATSETETYISVSGHYAIKQDGGFGQDQQTILLSPEQMLRLIADMREKLRDKKNWWSAEGAEQ